MSMAYTKVRHMYLYALKEDKPFDMKNHKALADEFWCDKDKAPVSLWFGYHDWTYNEDNFYLLYQPFEKLEFAYACLFNDAEIDALVKKWLPEVEVIKKSSYRRGFPLQEQLDKYNISLEDFILNGRYIIVLDDGFHWSDMAYHGLIDFNKFTEETADQYIECN